MEDHEQPERYVPPPGVRNFRDLLEAYRVQSRSGDITTHTSLAEPAGAFHVPGCAYEHFLIEYAKAIGDGERLHLTERPCQHFPLLVDLDFRFPIGDVIADAVNTPPLGPRDAEFVDAVILAYSRAVRQLLANAVNRRNDGRGDEIVETFVCHVLQRDAPYECKGVLKDGLHLVFSNLRLTAVVQDMVRERAMPELAAAIGRLAGQLNPLEDVVDACVTRNNWTMYGSRKPGLDPYVETRMVTVSPGDVIAPCHERDQLAGTVDRLAMRKARCPAALNPTAYREIAEVQKRLREAHMQRMIRDDAALQQHKNTSTCHSLDVDLARQLVPLLSPARADGRDDWMRVGWCLRNIDDSLLAEWDVFSKQSPKYELGECARLWPHYKNDHGLGVRTLAMWAREDDPQGYAAIRAKRNCGLVDRAVASMAHFDVARVVFEEYKDQYVCVAPGGAGKWYRFLDHRWRCTTKAVEMRTALSTSVHDAFERRAKALQRESVDLEPTEASKVVAKYAEMCKSLKHSGFKDSVMREASDLFYRDKFEGRLDSHEDLIGFENGVYDLSTGVFRDGRPEDMVSMSTGHDYVEVPDGAPEFAEIEAFFATVFPSPGLRRYFLSRMAAYLSGRIIKEEFLILTGSGSNGKSKTIELLQSALGEYAVNLPTALLTQKRGASNAASPEVARLKGRRLAVMQEPSDTDRLNISILKEATGSDVMQARPLYGEPFEFRPQFSMVLTCNTLPIVPDNDGGTWRRIKVVEFGSKFTSTPDPSDPTHFPIDLHLSDKFGRWRPAFVSMLLRIHAEQRGRPMPEPEEVNRACNEYREDQDVYSSFVTETFVQDAAAQLDVAEAYSAFRAWAKARAMSQSSQPKSAKALSKKISTLGKLRFVGSRSYWAGWTLKREGDDYA